MHWADQLAEQIMERAKKEGKPANVRCGQTPSGAKHIGNLNDVARAYLPYKSAVEMGGTATFAHTTDDRDPLKDIPAKVPDLKGEWHAKEELPKMDEYLGRPLCRIPDPFKCCSSWSEHFTKVWMDGVKSLGMHPELHSVDELYKKGKMQKYVREVFEKREQAGEIIAAHQATKSKDYIPFDAICPNCGVLSNVDSFDLENETVHFSCGGKNIKKKKAEGCGEDAEVPWQEGKLQWRFEWPAMWALFGTTYEPFGKDHAEGSWKSGQEIAKEIYGIEPPIPFVYEFFLVNGEKMSASKGNVYIVQDLLKVMEPEAFMFFYAKRPEKQRDLELKRISALEDEFDSAEKVYFGKEEARSENREENTKRMYELSVPKRTEKYGRRISYSFAASLIQMNDESRCIEILKKMKHIESREEEEMARERLKLAKNWIGMYAPEEAKVGLLSKEEAEVRIAALPENERNALKKFAKAIMEKETEDELMGEIKKICEEEKMSVQNFFRASYLALIGKERGPKLLAFIEAIGKEKVAEVLS